MITGFHHLAIQVRDLSKAEEFYGGLLGLPVVARHRDSSGRPRSIWVGLAGGGFLALELCHGQPPAKPFRDPTPGLHLLALGIRVEERRQWEQKLARAGFEKIAETPFTFYVLDPEGNRIGFSHHPHLQLDGGEG